MQGYNVKKPQTRAGKLDAVETLGFCLGYARTQNVLSSKILSAVASHTRLLFLKVQIFTTAQKGRQVPAFTILPHIC